MSLLGNVTERVVGAVMNIAKPEEIGRLDTKLSVAIREKEVLHKDWQKWWKFYDGQQSDDLEFEDWQRQDYSVINFIKARTLHNLPVLLSADPDWFVVAGKRDQDDFALELQTGLQGLRERIHLNRELGIVYIDALINGTGALKVWWDQFEGPLDEAGNSLGEVAVDWIDPFTVYPDPDARKFKNCEYIAVCHKYSPALVQRLYPNADMSRLKRGVRYPTKEVDIRGAASESDLIEVWEVWYDFGQTMCVYSGAQFLVEPMESPVPSKKYPFHFFPINPQGRFLWGESEIKDLIDLQLAINLANLRIATHSRSGGNSPWVTNDAKFEGSNEPGATLLVHGDAWARREPPVPLPPYFFDHEQALKYDFDMISGTHNVMVGKREKGIQAGVAIQLLQQAGMSRLSLPIENWGEVHAEIGQQVLDLMGKYYREDRSISVVRDKETTTQTIEPRMFGDTVMTGTGPVQIPYEYRVITQPSGDLPISQAARAEYVIQLASMQLLPGSMAVEQLRLPNSERLIAELKQIEMSERQLAILQLQMQIAQIAGPQGMGQGPSLEDVASQLAEILDDEQMQMVAAIRDSIQSGQELTEEQMAFVQGLPPDLQELINIYVSTELE